MTTPTDNRLSVEQLIRVIRTSDDYIKDIFTMGGCYRFHLILKTVFPHSVPYLNKQKDHVISMIDGRFYDIRGRLTKKQYKDFAPLLDRDLWMVKRWSFNKNHVLKITECPACEEPICV